MADVQHGASSDEAAVAYVPALDASVVSSVQHVQVEPTQIRKPWRATARTAFQAFVALCFLFPVLVSTAGLDPASLPWLAIPIAIAAGVSRVMALPQVEVFLRKFLPFLSASGRQ